ncbi:MAG: DUF2059 domain-containing protein [Polyangia bacterium]|jgi:hypothetical protein
MKRLVIGLSLLLSCTAFAGSPQKAHALVLLVMPHDRWQSMIDQMTKQMMATMPTAGMPADAAARFKAVMEEVIPYDEVVDIDAQAFGKYFDDGELDSLRKFYESPVGKKSARLMPELMGDAMKHVMQVLPQRMPAALERHGLLPKK